MSRGIHKMLLMTCLLVLTGGGRIFGQPAQDFIHPLFEAYRSTQYEEKIYLHTAQSSFLAGEMLWCRAYLVEAHTHRPSTLSKVAYLELMDGRGKPVWQATVRIDSGMGTASWQIPQALPTGQYLLRAYTRWMRNQDRDFFFRKDILILNPSRKPMAPLVSQDSIAISAFAEGGQLVAGLENRITYLVQDISGKGISQEVFLVRDGKDTLLRSKPVRFGMGDFLMVPEQGRRYTLCVARSSAVRTEASLPEVQAAGYAIRADTTAERLLEIKVQVPQGMQDRGCYLFVHCRNTSARAFYEPFRNGVAVFRLPLAEMGDGINQLTVFNERKTPVAERLWFVKPLKKLLFRVDTDSDEYPIRSPLHVSVQSATETGKPAAASFSAAVLRMPDSVLTDASDILSYLYLESDLKGRIENPGFYFSNDPNSTAIQADLLMRTHGWRRFRWEDILENNPRKINHLPEYSGPLADILVSGKSGREPLPGRAVAVTIPGTRFHLGMGISGSNGRLAFPLAQREGSGELAFQVFGAGSDTTQVVPLPTFDSAFETSVPPLRGMDEAALKQMSQDMVDIQLSQAFGRLQPGNIRAYPQADTTPFFGTPEGLYQLDDYVRFTTMEEIFREYVREVDVRKNRNQYRLLVTNLPMRALFQEDPLILLDGIPQRDVNRVMQYDPLRIKSIAIVARRYQLGGLSFPGIISLQTYAGNLDGFELPPGLLVTDYEGLQVWREFTSPSYPATQDNRYPDLRRLLHWLPDGKTDAGKTTDMRFFSSDLPGRYAIVIQGMDTEGRAGTAVQYITVR